MKQTPLLKLLLPVAFVLLLITSCKKQDSVNDKELDAKALAGPLQHTGTVPDNPPPYRTPQVRDVYKPFIGVWYNSYAKKTYVFTADGRVALRWDRNGDVGYNVGVLDEGDSKGWFNFYWKFVDPEYMAISASTNTLTVVIENFQRIGGAADVEAAYNSIYNSLKTVFEAHDRLFPVGSIINTAANQYDPNPGKVIAGAQVFQTTAHFEHSYSSTKWYDMPDGTVNGFDGFSRTDVWLMPNGRFFMQLWLWDQVNPSNSQSSYTHQFSWGRYTILKGTNVMDGDLVNVVYDNGSTACYRIKGGQTTFESSLFYYQK